jgi:TatA/E family protein of Tat protein translocase
MGSVGTPEILLILVIALLLFGPQKLPELGKSLGRAIREFKKASSELQETIEREVEEVNRTAREEPKPSPSSPAGLPAGALPPPSAPMPAPPPPAAEKSEEAPPPPPLEPR